MGQEYSATTTSSVFVSEVVLVSVSELALEQELLIPHSAIKTANPKGRSKFSFIQKLILKGIKKYLNKEIKEIFLD